MIHLDCVRRVPAVVLTAILIFTAGAAFARGGVDTPVPTPRPPYRAAAIADISPSIVITAPPPVLSIISEDPVADDDTPTIVKTLRHLYCVKYARLRSGIAIFGNAKTWWAKAKGLYDQSFAPQPGAVMVFASVRKMRLGHVAVVRKIVSSREIRIDHANWLRDGNIYLNAPVIDVSENNDWSKVRVWNTRIGQWGGNVFPIKGFVSFRRTAMVLANSE